MRVGVIKCPPCNIKESGFAGDKATRQTRQPHHFCTSMTHLQNSTIWSLRFTVHLFYKLTSIPPHVEVTRTSFFQHLHIFLRTLSTLPTHPLPVNRISANRTRYNPRSHFPNLTINNVYRAQKPITEALTEERCLEPNPTQPIRRHRRPPRRLPLDHNARPTAKERQRQRGTQLSPFHLASIPSKD